MGSARRQCVILHSNPKATVSVLQSPVANKFSLAAITNMLWRKVLYLKTQPCRCTEVSAPVFVHERIMHMCFLWSSTLQDFMRFPVWLSLICIPLPIPFSCLHQCLITYPCKHRTTCLWFCCSASLPSQIFTELKSPNCQHLCKLWHHLSSLLPQLCCSKPT